MDPYEFGSGQLLFPVFQWLQRNKLPFSGMNCDIVLHAFDEQDVVGEYLSYLLPHLIKNSHVGWRQYALYSAAGGNLLPWSLLCKSVRT